MCNFSSNLHESLPNVTYLATAKNDARPVAETIAESQRIESTSRNGLNEFFKGPVIIYVEEGGGGEK